MAEHFLAHGWTGQAVLEHIADVRRAIIKGSTLAVLLSEEKNM